MASFQPTKSKKSNFVFIFYHGHCHLLHLQRFTIARKTFIEANKDREARAMNLHRVVYRFPFSFIHFFFANWISVRCLTFIGIFRTVIESIERTTMQCTNYAY